MEICKRSLGGYFISNLKGEKRYKEKMSILNFKISVRAAGTTII